MSHQAIPNTSTHLLDVWQRHIYAEFVTKDVEAALATMTEDAHVLLIPSNTGGVGKEGVRRFYANEFIPHIPTDIQAITISQTLGPDILIEEAVHTFTHNLPMEWMIPGVPATGKRIEVAVIGIIKFRDDKVLHEHLYWDQASVLVQLGLLKPDKKTPLIGVEGVRRLLEWSGYMER
jgi:carboxymethylenebutenolidase